MQSATYLPDPPEKTSVVSFRWSRKGWSLRLPSEQRLDLGAG